TDGWIDLRPAQGAFVHTPSEDEVDQLLGVRTVLETYSARLAAENATPGDVNRLWELQQDGLDALAADDSEALVTANVNLHAAITEVAGNSVLAKHIGLVERRWHWYYLPIAQPRGQGAWTEHAELIKAIAARDADLASSIMARPTERTRQVYHDQRQAKSDSEGRLGSAGHRLIRRDPLDPGVDVHRRSAQEPDQRQPHLPGQ